MLTTNQLMAFVSTANPGIAKIFYRDTLGLTLVREEMPFALVFDCAGIMLRVSIVDALAPAPFTVLGWHTADIAATVKELVAKGVVFTHYPGMGQDDLNIWTSPSGAKIAWFKDPDGNTLSLAQA